MTEWTLPWPDVTTNHLWRIARGHVGMMMNPKATAWKDETILTVRASGLRLPAGPLALTIYAYPPRGWRGDADNLAKLTQDSLFAAFDDDDRRVAELHIYRAAGSRTPRLEVQIEPVRWRTIDEVRAS